MKQGTELHLVAELEGMVEDAESHAAVLLRELQMAHEALTARTAENSAITLSLSERLNAMRRRSYDAARLRTFVDHVNRNVAVASQSADEMGQLALAAMNEAVSARAAYESLHAHARERVAGLAEALARSRHESENLRTSLVETGVLLCQTHAAVCAAHATVPSIHDRIRFSLTFPPPARCFPPAPCAAWHAARGFAKTPASSAAALPDRVRT